MANQSCSSFLFLFKFVSDIFFVLLVGIYDARMRTVLKFMSLVLGVLPEEIEDLEDAVQSKFQEDEHEPTEYVAT